MSKYLITADWHLREDQPECRTDDFKEAQISKLKQINALALEESAITLFAGDLFHTFKVEDSCKNLFAKHIPAMLGIPGNHDLKYHRMDNLDQSSFSVLCNYGRIIDPKEGVIDTLDYGSLEAQKNSNANILMMHYFTFPDKPPFPGCNTLSAKELLIKFPQYKLIIIGDNHTTFVVEYEGRILVSPGSLTRFCADQVNHKPCVFIYDTAKHELKQRFLYVADNVITREHIDKKQEKESRFEALIQTVNISEQLDTISIDKSIDDYILNNNVSKKVQEFLIKAKEIK